MERLRSHAIIRATFIAPFSWLPLSRSMSRTMSIEKTLHERSDSKCELCGATDGLNVYELPSSPTSGSDQSVLLCNACRSQIDEPDKVDANHWRCLNDSMWSQVPAVQVMAWRMLTRQRAEGWPQDLLDMLYLDEET